MILPTNNEEAKAYSESFFGRAYIHVARFPHCIIESTRENLELILSITKTEAIGVWGDRPILGADGEVYFPSTTAEIIKNFGLWKLGRNQEFARTNAAFGRVEGFVMAFNVNVAPETLKILHGICGSDHTLEYYKYLDVLPLLLSKLDWAYIPLDKTLSSAVADALFIAPMSQSLWVSELKQAMAQVGRQCFEFDGNALRFKACRI